MLQLLWLHAKPLKNLVAVKNNHYLLSLKIWRVRNLIASPLSNSGLGSLMRLLSLRSLIGCFTYVSGAQAGNA